MVAINTCKVYYNVIMVRILFRKTETTISSALFFVILHYNIKDILLQILLPGVGGVSAKHKNQN